MQGQRSMVGSLPELSFHSDSATSEAGIDPQRRWNNLLNPAQDQLSDFVISASNASVPCVHSAGLGGHNLSGWHSGESSSSAARDPINQVDRNIGGACVLGGRQLGSSDSLTLNNSDMDTDQVADGHLFMQTSMSTSIPQDHYRSSGFFRHDDEDDDDEDDDDCQIIECASAYKSRSPNDQLPGTSSSSQPFSTASGSGGFLMEESDGRPSCSLDGRRSSCKRKTIEGSAGQSSGSGSSDHLHAGESSFWHAAVAPQNTTSSIHATAGNNLTISLPQVHPRLALSMGRVASEVPPHVSASASAESSHRNFRLRINSSFQQDYNPGNVNSTESSGGTSNVLSAQHSMRLQPGNNSLGLRPSSAADNGSAQRQAVAVHTPLRQSPQSRWYRASTSGASSSGSVFTGERDVLSYDGPFLGSVPRSISEQPMFLPATETGNSSQSPVNWSLSPGNISIGGNPASSSHSGLSSGVNAPAPHLIPTRSSPQYPRRLSEFVRRSYLGSSSTESGSQNSSFTPMHSGPASSSREITLPSGSGHHGHRRYTRSALLLERHLGSAFGFPYSGRTSAAAGEGRHRLVSEQIRNVLDLMRRGEGLRIEDVMILDQSVFFGMADIDDHHRDMRLDVDNMSYEELLALEERIGSVCTGLNEETITRKLKQRKYICIKTVVGQAEAEPCCICQEEYNDGEDLGTLECGHDFHSDCIKQWLMQKNLCPICKTTGLTK